MNLRRRIDEYGFTLIETLISIVAMGIIMGSLYSFLITQRQYFSLQEEMSEMIQNTRATMDMMVSEISMAGYNPAEATFDGIPHSTSQLQVYADINGNGVLTDSNENIIYIFDESNKRILRNTGGGNQPLSENINGFVFEYLDDQGNVTTITSKIRQVRLTVTGQTGKPDPSYAMNSGHRTYTLTSEVTPRNLNDL